MKLNLTALLRPTLALGLTLGVVGVTLTGCETDKAGIDSNYRSQWTLVNGDVSEATDAAEDVLSEYDLKDVESNSTELDGNAMGKMADGTEVSVDIRRATDETSEVTVQVGKLGDPTLGVEIADKIKQQLMD